MGKPFIVPDVLLPIVQEIYDFLIDFEENRRIEVKINAPQAAWFSVTPKKSKGKSKGGILWVKGDLNSYRFSLHINGTDMLSAAFESVDAQADTEHLFYLFINLIEQYRINNKLSPLNTRIIHGLAIEDSPPVSPENYKEVPLDKNIERLIQTINLNFKDKSFTERHGRFSFFICSDMGNILFMPFQYIPVFTKLLDSFKAQFPVSSVQLLAIRWAGTQRLFFIAEKKRLFSFRTKKKCLYCCKTDGSLEFLKEHFIYIFNTIAVSPSGLFSKSGLNMKSRVPGIPSGIPRPEKKAK
jgi:hypothetical protein